MKAYIGPYLTWWGPYQIADLLQKVGVSEDRCHDIGKRLSETWVGDLCQWIHDKRTRNVSIKLDPWDSWSADSTIATIAAPLLKQLQKNKHGIPGSLYEGDEFDAAKIKRYNEILGNEDYSDEGKEQRDKDYAEAEAIWNEIMNEMIFALEACYKEDHEPNFWIEKPSPPEFVVHPGMPGYTEIVNRRAGKMDLEAYKAYHQRVQNGLVLFGRYFKHLWD